MTTLEAIVLVCVLFAFLLWAEGKGIWWYLCDAWRFVRGRRGT